MVDQHTQGLYAYGRGNVTETIDLASLFGGEVTSSGSFDLRGVQATSLGKLLQALPMPAILVDRSHAIVFANEAWGETRADFQQIEGRTFSCLFPHAEQAMKARSLIEKVFSDRKSRVSEVFMSVNDRQIWGRMHLRPLRMGNQRYILTLIQDVTPERKQILLTRCHATELEKTQVGLEKRDRERTRELAEANAALKQEIAERKRAEELLVQTVRLKAVAELAGGVAHNFNNLLQIVMGNAETALVESRTGNSAAVQSSLRQILESARFGADLVRRLQSFAGVRSQDEPQEGAVFDFSDTVRQAIEMSRIWWESLPSKQRISIRMISDVRDGCTVKGNEAELFQVVLSLIKNAVEALPLGGDIEVSSIADGRHVVLKVRDTGLGIKEKDLGKIFEPFFTTKGFQTSGMGLAAAYGIVSRHGGDLSVESKEGRGSTFSVTLPFSGQAKVAEAGPVQAAGLWEKILVVDDFEPIVRILAEGLAQFGKTVYTALSGEEGLAILRDHPVDLVICDLGMPGMNGFQVSERIRDLCLERDIPKPPFLLLTGWGGQVEEDEELARSGVDMVVEKPIDIAELLHIVDGMIQRGTTNPAR
jgi:PAS domain S-box-containing protein